MTISQLSSSRSECVTLLDTTNHQGRVSYPRLASPSVWGVTGLFAQNPQQGLVFVDDVVFNCAHNVQDQGSNQ